MSLRQMDGKRLTMLLLLMVGVAINIGFILTASLEFKGWSEFTAAARGSESSLVVMLVAAFAIALSNIVVMAGVLYLMVKNEDAELT